MKKLGLPTECDGCRQKRKLTKYSELDERQARFYCTTCADVGGLEDLINTPEGQLLVEINSKLDMLMARTREKR